MTQLFNEKAVNMECADLNWESIKCGQRKNMEQTKIIFIMAAPEEGIRNYESGICG